MRDAQELSGDEGIRADDYRTCEPVRFRVQELPRNGNFIGILRLLGARHKLLRILRPQRGAVKGAHTASAAYCLHNGHFKHPFLQFLIPIRTPGCALR